MEPYAFSTADDHRREAERLRAEARRIRTERIPALVAQRDAAGELEPAWPGGPPVRFSEASMAKMEEFNCAIETLQDDARFLDCRAAHHEREARRLAKKQHEARKNGQDGSRCTI